MTDPFSGTSDRDPTTPTHFSVMEPETSLPRQSCSSSGKRVREALESTSARRVPTSIPRPSCSRSLTFWPPVAKRPRGSLGEEGTDQGPASDVLGRTPETDPACFRLDPTFWTVPSQSRSRHETLATGRRGFGFLAKPSEAPCLASDQPWTVGVEE